MSQSKRGSMFLKIPSVPGSVNLLEGGLHSEYYRGVGKASVYLKDNSISAIQRAHFNLYLVFI